MPHASAALGGYDPPLLRSVDSLSLVLDQLDYQAMRETAEVCKAFHAAVRLNEWRGKALCKIDFEDIPIAKPIVRQMPDFDWVNHYERKGVRFVGTSRKGRFPTPSLCIPFNTTGISEGDEGNWKLEGTSGSRFLGFNYPDQYVCLLFRGRGVSRISFDAVCRIQTPMNVTAYAKNGTTLCCHNMIVGPAEAAEEPLYNSSAEDEYEEEDDIEAGFTKACRQKQVDACYSAKFIVTTALDAGMIAGSCTWTSKAASTSRAPCGEAHECRMALRDEDRIGALKITAGEIVHLSPGIPGLRRRRSRDDDDTCLGLDNIEVFF